MKNNIYTIDRVPNGKNKLTSRAGFVQRLNYEFMFETLKNKIDTNFYDLKNEFLFYLKYDSNNNIINISEAYLKNIDIDVYVVDIVADAFNDLKKLCFNSQSISDEKFKELKPKKGWENLHKKYHDHVNLIYKKYINYLNNFKKDKKILNFDDFVVSFINFLDQIAFKVPFLKSSFFLSKDYPVSNTGFVIEIDETSKDKDNEKLKNYFGNRNFYEFATFCKNTGFAIDKDCPWRIIFNPFATESLKYFENNSVDKEQFFTQYFYKTEDFDLENLKNYFIIFYNTFVEEYPLRYNPKITTYNEKNIIINNTINRDYVIKEEIDLKYKDLFWFNLYCHIKFVENKIKLNNQQYKIILNNLNQDFKIHGYIYAVKQLNMFVSKCDKVKTKDQYNFTFPSAD